MKHIIVFSLALFAISFVAHSQAIPQSPSEKLFEEATDLFNKEKYAVAQHLFDKYMQQSDADEGNVALAAYSAAVCSEQLRNDDALFRLNEFMRLYPESDRVNMARMAMGNVFFDKGDYNSALRQYLQVEPSEVEFNHRNEYEYKTGYCYFQQGDKENAKKYFKRVSDGKSYYKNAATYYYADILFSSKQYESADKEFRKIEKDKAFKKLVPIYRFYIKYHLGYEDDVLRMAPDLLNDPNLVLRDEVERIVGDVYFNRGEYSRALEYYTQANADAARKNGGKSSATGNYAMGYCYYMLGQYDSAAVYLSSYVGKDDSTAQNALFTLGDTYVKQNRKADARSAFKSASEMRHNPSIQEEALFNYAKLSCELNPNAYNESIRSFENYLQRYPKSKRKSEIQQILTTLYCTTKNYKDALALIERNKKELLKDATMRQAYQRILVNRGIDLFNERNLQQAAVCFDSAVSVNATPAITTDALYLSAESQYRLANYAKSQKLLNRFFTATSRKSSVYYPQALYTAGYVYMRNKNYSLAEEKFAEFLQQSAAADRKQTLDAYNRMGDCLYVRKNFDGAISFYDKVITAGGQDADYATYQKALCYGAQGKQVEKLNSLNYIFEKFSNSPLSPKAMFEIANTYLICDNNEMAMLYYNNFIKKYSQSSYVPQALLNMGLIYYNTDRNDKALETFDRLLTRYPGTDEARDALMAVKNIYIDQDRAEEYFSYVSRTTKGSVSAVEQDSTLYLAAENRYFAGNYDNAIAGFSNYIQKFPHGLFILKAHYYLADALSRTNQNDKALSHYEWVAERGNNPYTENCLYQAATIHYGHKDYKKALNYYVPLVVVSSTDASRLQARMGIVRCWYALKDTGNVAISSREILNEPKATDEQKDEVRMLLSRSYYYDGDYDKAFSAYSQLMNSANGDFMGEAAFRRAQIRFSQERYDDAESIIEQVVNNPGSDYWLAKSFILWADIFHRRGNDLQAKQTLQSIIDNYEVADDADEEVVMEARQHLQALDNTAPAATAEEDSGEAPTIELDFDNESDN